MKKIIVPLIGIAIFLILMIYFFISNDQIVNQLKAMGMHAEYLGRENVEFQTSKNDCGIRSIGMLLKTRGKTITQKEIDSLIKNNPNGLSMLQLKTIALMHGVEVTGWNLSYTDLKHSPFPSLLFVHGDHFVVADSATEREIYIRDPGLGRLKMGREEFQSIWKGQSLVLK